MIEKKRSCSLTSASGCGKASQEAMAGLVHALARFLKAGIAAASLSKIWHEMLHEELDLRLGEILLPGDSHSLLLCKTWQR